MASSHNIIFLHGWGTSPSAWKYQIEYFSKRYNTSAPELGLTLYPIPYTLYPVLIGWSYGGMLGIELAAAGPDRFKALVLVGSSAKFSEHGTNQVVIKNIRRNLNREFEAMMRNCYRQFFSAEEAGFIDEFVKGQIIPDKKTTIGLLDKLAVLDLKNCLKDIKIPTLIIHGDKDEICRVGAGQYLNQNIKGSQIKIIKGAGHMPFYTRPEEFNEILEEFIEGVN